MQRLALTLLCLVVGATATHDTGKRIINGRPAEHHSHPYIASLRKAHSGEHFCGGTIISRSWILTAAHCAIENFYVVVGAISRHGHGSPNEYEQAINVSEIIVHEDFSIEGNFPNDIALLKLDRAIETGRSKNVEAAKLVTKGFPVIDTACVMSGWGLTSEAMAKHLQETEMTAISNQECNTVWPDADVNDDQICVFDRKKRTMICHTDSGGPMMCGPNRDYLTGVASWVFRDCLTTKPGVYTRVSSYLDWIKAKSGVRALTPFQYSICEIKDLNNHDDCVQYLQKVYGIYKNGAG